jgi:hypothetical protein
MADEVYLEAIKGDNPSEEFWGFDQSEPPVGNAAIPFSELDIHSAADVVDGIEAGDYGEKPQKVVKMLYAADENRDRHDIANLIKYQIKSERWPSLNIFFPKNSDWARWWEIEKGTERRESIAVPYAEQSPGGVRFGNLYLREQADWLKMVSEGKEQVGAGFKRKLDKIVGDAGGDYLKAADEISMDSEVINQKIINPTILRAAQERVSEIERLSAERAAEKKAAAVPPLKPRLTEIQKEIRRLDKEAALEETWGPGGVKMKELKPVLQKKLQKGK